MASVGETVATTPAVEATEGGFYRWYVVAVLFLAYCFSAIDARVLTLLVIPIKQDLGISDFEISLLQGFAFALLYSVAAIPIGRYVDGIPNGDKITLANLAGMTSGVSPASSAW